MLENSALQTRRAFGVLFVAVSAAVGAGSVLSELAAINNMPVYWYAVIWIGSFGAVLAGAGPRFRKAIPAIRGRMKNSIKWSTGAKAINGVSWAGPFAAIGAFPHLYQYFILLGIGLGNLSTYILMKKYSGQNNPEQLLVGAISLVALPVALVIDGSLFATHQDIAVMVSRILIAIAYAVGGAYALLSRK
ncbi:hypothetical protein NTE_01630 [Candidatus Nitrososphaera evergladensis SR1]|uniref:Uncharacterized protein n=1 Tax=Candidatus Nitrososphaera evergladensis SR1 TaxID=1459636 RepID=A0A075MQ54_9ARCH|nr:hypothetical protein [Candidatus Nitrososphaera evergladensis]AIF83691.1 hypothetical protein NTE_01630 [Candidatus Nitrososphaera evergladensis SR1]